VKLVVSPPALAELHVAAGIASHPGQEEALAALLAQE